MKRTSNTIILVTNQLRLSHCCNIIFFFLSSVLTLRTLEFFSHLREPFGNIPFRSMSCQKRGDKGSEGKTEISMDRIIADVNKKLCS